jgi:hypothetical protein
MSRSDMSFVLENVVHFLLISVCQSHVDATNGGGDHDDHSWDGVVDRFNPLWPFFGSNSSLVWLMHSWEEDFSESEHQALQEGDRLD